MNTELFKAKRVDNEEWVEGYLIKSFTGICYIVKDFDHLLGNIVYYEVDEKTICQCTGCPDMNGDMIWGNDIVKGAWWDKGESRRHIGIVSYVGCAYKVVGVKQYRGLHDELNGSYTVIGNIFDNPDYIQ